MCYLLYDPDVGNDSLRKEENVKVCESYAEEAHPGPEHVMLVPHADLTPDPKARRALRKYVELPANEMAEGMTGERV